MVWPVGRRRIRELVNDFYEPLYRYAYRLTGRSDRAEDLTQETFCRAQMQWRQLRNKSEPRPWLYSILRNCFLRNLRDDRIKRQVPLEGVPEPFQLPEDTSPELSPLAVQDALNSLPEPYRTPIILFYFEEFSYKEMAEHMSVPIGTIMSRLARARDFLRRKLQSPTGGDVLGVRRDV